MNDPSDGINKEGPCKFAAVSQKCLLHLHHDHLPQTTSFGALLGKKSHAASVCISAK